MNFTREGTNCLKYKINKSNANISHRNNENRKRNEKCPDLQYTIMYTPVVDVYAWLLSEVYLYGVSSTYVYQGSKQVIILSPTDVGVRDIPPGDIGAVG